MKNRMKEFRFKNGEMTQDNIARMAGVSRQTIIAVEKGKFKPSVKLALKLANILHCTVEELFELEEGD
ncbi:XRE family transcriptional regulator [Mesotoga sp. HF07.pep.5.2.highcov]|uniref:Putative transcriptional regulator n=1 Tax=Mesotoga prima MesG1.Ag.4.2 TaxID=660470 RepID=I2F6L1_9BACT|nr:MULTISPECIES: helix-turn-helix transcriptional regulator [Mesotoga]AFK07564.1 putative transcriptional regulator [Mesotoga prima MesG1.Ag.4.2]PIJ60444.1 XRE family transcriptional regulator [Mesotoga sp. H07.pep.5.3]RLL90734.1 XRE family transcriptional regulator [Mesotoga sp. HF07.pep.5.2.highcov]